MTPSAVERLKKDHRYSQALTLGYLAGLNGEEPDAELGEINPRYDEGWLLGAAAREAGVTPKKFMGYHEEAELPVKRGHVVTIKKGTLVYYRGQTKPAKRTYRVIVNHILPGQNMYLEGSAFRQEVKPMVSPTVRWPGSGGYWSEVDINDIPEAQ